MLAIALHALTEAVGWHVHPSRSLMTSRQGGDLGSVAEWTIAPALKVGGPRGSGGSNPSASADVGA